MTEIFSDIPIERKKFLIWYIDHKISGTNPFDVISNILSFIKTLPKNEQEFIDFYIQTIFCKETEDESNFN